MNIFKLTKIRKTVDDNCTHLTFTSALRYCGQLKGNFALFGLSDKIKLTCDQTTSPNGVDFTISVNDLSRNHKAFGDALIALIIHITNDVDNHNSTDLCLTLLRGVCLPSIDNLIAIELDDATTHKLYRQYLSSEVSRIHRLVGNHGRGWLRNYRNPNTAPTITWRYNSVIELDSKSHHQLTVDLPTHLPKSDSEEYPLVSACINNLLEQAGFGKLGISNCNYADAHAIRILLGDLTRVVHDEAVSDFIDRMQLKVNSLFRASDTLRLDGGVIKLTNTHYHGSMYERGAFSARGYIVECVGDTITITIPPNQVGLDGEIKFDSRFVCTVIGERLDQLMYRQWNMRSCGDIGACDWIHVETDNDVSALLWSILEHVDFHEQFLTQVVPSQENVK